MKTQKNRHAKAAIYGLFALMVVGTLTISFASAYRGDYTVKGPNCNEERHEAMETAFESSEYTAWSNLMAEDGRHPRVLDVVTESNFDTFAQAHAAAEYGDYELAANLRAELGLNNGNGPQDGNGHKMGQGEGQQRHRNNCDDGNCGNMGSGQGKGRH
ncbi:MAG: hypothetical protein DRN71_05150 [Candidatus Nanohalarchaeota archaeon]|nr:MAG: hypothetical protein DRN71_05150 [Candidatus Nanohaloarchaeota archaeon]